MKAIAAIFAIVAFIAGKFIADDTRRSAAHRRLIWCGFDLNRL
jgi:hypothetical protein